MMDDLVRLTGEDREMLKEASEILEGIDCDDEDTRNFCQYLAGRLAGLSGRVPDAATDTIQRPMSEIIAAEKEFFDKRWYDRSSMIATKEIGPKKYRDLGAKGRKRIEEQYGKENLGPYTDFEWGELHGKHIAMRWVLDPEAGWDDEGLGDT